MLRSGLCFFLFTGLVFCQTKKQLGHAPCEGLKQRIAKEFKNVEFKTRPGQSCRASLFVNESRLDYAEDLTGRLYKNLSLYQTVFEQSEMKVKRKRLKLAGIETVRLEIIPKRSGNRVKTINYYQKYRNVSFGQSARADVIKLAIWLMSQK